uniref:Uncharacterized protein n=1 Tax=Phaseolus vulgaris TaxID=3885 RepID=V7C135_PHAVU|nr:hypothetical protein PHAVU_004G084200g [Phaseolus vulgaris]ESW23882.1 hypothetical protein PHAVU_004G084200g [Phaseolus vulgaris]
MPLHLLVSLNLSSNLFSGPIPSSFGALSTLEVLDLSNNSFSGQIPDYLTNMQSLTRLILSNNPLSGEIPKFSHNVNVEYFGTNLIKMNRTTEIPTRSPRRMEYPLQLRFSLQL